MENLENATMEEKSVATETTNPVEPKKKKMVFAKNKAEAFWAILVFGAFVLLSIYNTVHFVQGQIRDRQLAKSAQSMTIDPSVPMFPMGHEAQPKK